MRPLTKEDYLDIWHRRKWWFAATAFLVSAGTCLVAALQPNQYQSSALILLEGPLVVESAAKSASDADINQQLDALVQQTLSRTRLEHVLRELGEASADGPVPDSVVDALRQQISVKIMTEDIGSPNRKGKAYALRVGFITTNPAVAQRVTNELASFFVAQKLKTDEQAAQDTLRFLQAQLDAAAKDAAEKQQRLMGFKKQYAGQLQVDEPLILQTLARLQSQMQTNQQALDRARQEQAALDSAATAAPAEKSGAQGSANKLQAHLESLRAHLADIQSRYTPTHPDIIKTRDEIARVEEELAQDEDNEASATKAVPKVASGRVGNRKREVEAEVAALQHSQKRLEEQTIAYQANLQAIPVRQQEYNTLQREYDDAKGNYEKVLAKFQDAQLAGNVETRLQGQRFRVQDFASLPDRPVSPDRLKINLGGLAAGLMAGLVLAGAFELRDSSMKSERDVEYYLEVKNLAVVPELRTNSEQRLVRGKKLICAYSGASLALTLSALLGYLYLLRK